jgi:hypothetical protein
LLYCTPPNRLKKVKEESEVQQKAIEEASPLERESKEEGNMTS